MLPDWRCHVFSDQLTIFSVWGEFRVVCSNARGHISALSMPTAAIELSSESAMVHFLHGPQKKLARHGQNSSMFLNLAPIRDLQTIKLTEELHALIHDLVRSHLRKQKCCMQDLAESIADPRPNVNA